MEDVDSLLDLRPSGRSKQNKDSDSDDVAAKLEHVRDFRQTVKALSTQVTPQSSPLSMYSGLKFIFHSLLSQALYGILICDRFY